jgi:hypothetical protein
MKEYERVKKGRLGKDYKWKDMDYLLGISDAFYETLGIENKEKKRKKKEEYEARKRTLEQIKKEYPRESAVEDEKSDPIFPWALIGAGYGCPGCVAVGEATGGGRVFSNEENPDIYGPAEEGCGPFGFICCISGMIGGAILASLGISFLCEDITANHSIDAYSVKTLNSLIERYNSEVTSVIIKL